MKKYPLYYTVLCFTVISLFFAACKKNIDPLLNEPLLSNITLHDKPFLVVKRYVSGKWKLEYSQGGILNSKYPARNIAYLELTANHIIIGNDSSGVIVDTAIVWKRGETIYGYSTYFLTYRYSPGFIFPYCKAIEQIYNDTLIIKDNLYDGSTTYYTRHN